MSSRSTERALSMAAPPCFLASALRVASLSRRLPRRNILLASRVLLGCRRFPALFVVLLLDRIGNLPRGFYLNFVSRLHDPFRGRGPGFCSRFLPDTRNPSGGRRRRNTSLYPFDQHVSFVLLLFLDGLINILVTIQYRFAGSVPVSSPLLSRLVELISFPGCEAHTGNGYADANRAAMTVRVETGHWVVAGVCIEVERLRVAKVCIRHGCWP